MSSSLQPGYSEATAERKPSKSSLRPRSSNSEQSEDKISNKHVAFVDEQQMVQGLRETPLHALLLPSTSQMHDKLSGRMISMKLIDESLAERVFQLDYSQGGLFPALRLDSRTIHRNILNENKPSVFQSMAKFHHKFGIRHYMLVMVLVLYCMLGGLMFMLLEREAEIESLEENIKKLHVVSSQMTKAIMNATNVDPNDLTAFLELSMIIRMLKVEGRFIGSIYHKYDLVGQRLTWDYNSAVFYSMTLFTTIGYGSIACQTNAGKVMSVIYSICGIPLMLVVLSDVGQVLLRQFTILYNSWRQICCRVRAKFRARHEFDYPMPMKNHDPEDSWDSESDDSDDSVEQKPFPMFLAIPIIFAYMLICSAIVSAFDYHDGLTDGLTFWNAFYYIFISVSTIGLGDVLPNNIEYSPVLSLMFLFGLALLSVVNATVYMSLHKRFEAAMNRLEEWLEALHRRRHGKEGYWVMKSLAPNIQILALALPLFDNEESIERRLQPENTDLGRKIFGPQRLSRSRSMVEQEIDEFRPTLGIFKMAPKTTTRNRSNTVAGRLLDNSCTLPSRGTVSRIPRRYSELIQNGAPPPRQTKERARSDVFTVH